MVFVLSVTLKRLSVLLFITQIIASSEQSNQVFSLSNSDEFFKKSIIKAEKKIHLNYKNIRTDIINDYILPKNLTTLINSDVSLL